MAAPVASDHSQQTTAGDQVEIQGKCKVLVAKLKEYLSNILRISGKLLVDNAVPYGQLPPLANAGADPAQYALLCENVEKFYVGCDQLESHLRLALAWQSHVADTRKHLPFNVASSGATTARTDADAQQLQAVSGADLSRIVQLQVTAARELHDLLVDAVAKLAVGGSGGGS